MIIFASILVILTSIISAYSYSSASIPNLFNAIGEENLGFILVFLASFIVTFLGFGRSRFFGENSGALVIMSLIFATSITYFGFYKSGMNLDVSGLFYGLGFSEMGLDLAVFFGTLVVGIVLFMKFKFNLLLIVGGLLFALGITGVIPNDGILFVAGGIMVAAWILMKYFGWRLKNTQYVRGMPSTRNVFKNKFYNK